MDTYEVHITIEPDGFATSEGAVRGYAEEHGLKFSKITGWDATGDGTRAFLTWQSEEGDSFHRTKFNLHQHIRELQIRGINVVRGKIETCVYDWRRDSAPSDR